MFFWNSLAFSMIQQMLAIWSLVLLPFVKLAWTSGRSQLTYCWNLVWRILSITSMWDECNCAVIFLYLCLTYLMSSRSIHFITNGKISFFFKAESYSTIYSTFSLSTHPLSYTYADSISFLLWIVLEAHIHLQDPVSISSGYIPNPLGLLDHVIVLFLSFLRNLKILFFSSVQSLSHVRLFATPWIAARQASLSITSSWSSLKLTSIESVMPSSHLILCRPLFLLLPIPPSIRVFSNESTLRMRWPKYWSFSLSIIPSKEISGLISFRMDWLDLLAVQGTLKNLLQHHSSKTPILRHSAFFTVQLSHPYMTTGKTTALTRWTFVSKLCLCFWICYLGWS